MVGTEDKQGALLDNARKEGVDFLFVFHVDVRTAGAVVQNTTRLELIETATGRPVKEIPQTAQLLNTRVDKDKNPVEKEMKKLFAAIDAKILMSELPTSATPEKVEGFVDKMLEEKHTNPLPVLAQLKYYYHKKMLNGDRFVEGAKKLVGEEKAKIVASATQDQLLNALAAYLPKERPQGKGP